MPVVSESGHIFNSLVVIQGKQARYRKWSNFMYETPNDFLP